MRFSLLALAVTIISCSFSVQAKMYKWVDEDGQIHFGDKIPPKYLVKAHDELNEHGVQTKHREAEKTAEEKARERRLKEERNKAALAEKKQKQLDRVLLDVYTTERDLVIARNSRLDAYATQIRMSEAYINDTNKNIVFMEKQVVQIKASGREVPKDLYNRITTGKQQVESQTEIMKSHKKQSDEISEQYNAYIERFRDVKAR